MLNNWCHNVQIAEINEKVLCKMHKTLLLLYGSTDPVCTASLISALSDRIKRLWPTFWRILILLLQPVWSSAQNAASRHGGFDSGNARLTGPIHVIVVIPEEHRHPRHIPEVICDRSHLFTEFCGRGVPGRGDPLFVR